MIKLIIGFLLIGTLAFIQQPEVKVAGAMKNIMVKGDLSAYLNLDTINKTNLYGIGPVAGLKGEIMVVDGKIYTTAITGNQLEHHESKVSEAAMLVYSYIPKWKPITINAVISSYAELEVFVEKTAGANGFNTDKPFAFKLIATPEKVNYHVIDWEKGTTHTMDNHKQFAYVGKLANSTVTMLGFYSKHHQSIFTHHTSFMHVHIMDQKSKTIGHLDELLLSGLFTVYLPEK